MKRYHSFCARTLTLAAMTAGVIFSAPVYSSKVDGTKLSHYVSKDDVYLNADTPGPDGLYYFQVSDPSTDVILSDDLASCRQVNVVGGVITSVVVTGCEHPTAAGAIPAIRVKLSHFNDTSSNGGVYKLELIQASCAVVNGNSITYPNSCAKTHNFKIGGVDSQIVSSLLSGTKYYDYDKNGAFGATESALGQGFTVAVSVNGGPATNIPTDAFGFWSAEVIGPGSYKACEVLLPNGWSQSGPAAGAVAGSATADGSHCWTGIIGDADISDLDFGNYLGVGGMKYFDANTDGLNTPGEAGIPGIKIKIAYCATVGCTPDNLSPATQVMTGAGGLWNLVFPLVNGKPVTNWRACEILPVLGWNQTGPVSGANAGGATADINKCWNGSVGVAAGTAIDFGNVCLGATAGAYSKGFWTNNNGKSILSSNDTATPYPGAGNWRSILNASNLANGNGTSYSVPVPPATFATAFSNFSSWLGSASATNMSNMLSAQLAAMELNVGCASLNPALLVYAGTPPASCNVSTLPQPPNAQGYMSVTNLMQDAVTELGLNKNSVSGSPDRACQEFVKTTLDNADNGKNFVQPGPCPVVYP
jgi:hypothetical protein